VPPSASLPPPRGSPDRRARARRILEFDASTHSAQSWKNGRESIELWDCSGDKKYEKCFPAIMKGAVGAILVYNPDDAEHINQLQYWHDKLIRPMKLNDEQVIVFQHRPQATFLPPKERKGTPPPPHTHLSTRLRELARRRAEPVVRCAFVAAQSGCCAPTTRARRR
jgi:hypothetical protein